MPDSVALLTPDKRREAVLDCFEQANSAPQRVLFAAIGALFLVIGFAGYVIPGLPGTVFLLMALWFFGQSNERMYRWMLSNRFFGRQLVDYKFGLGIPRLIKIIAVSCIVVFAGLSMYRLDLLWLQIGLGLLAGFGIGFILTRPTREQILANAKP